MKALLMSAGVGTRLEPLTLAMPKPLVPICNIPVMQYNINLLRRSGIKDIVANLHYFPEQIQHYFKNGASFGVNIRYSYEEQLSGTAGGVSQMARSAQMADDTFIVLSSDVLMDIDLKALVRFHKKKKALATIALVEVDDTSEFGVVVLDKEKRITEFQEKPDPEDALSNLVNTGVYVFNRKILSMIPKAEFYDFGKQLFPLLVKKGFPFYGYESSAYWKDIGNIANYKKANFDILRNKSKKSGILIGKNSKVEEGADLEGRVIIGDNCIVRKGALIKDSIIWPDVIIDSGAKIDSSIVGSWCYIEENASIGKDSVIANRCRVKAGARIPPNTSISPDNIL